jgi:long-subunit fatty acid transport protein
MKRIFLISSLLFATILFAQELPERLLLSSGQQLGSGARALGLGGTYTGISDDFSGIWWNPAGLSQVKRIEVQGTLLRTGFSNDASALGVSREGTTDAMRLNNIGVVFPVPVYQGALSFAFGYSQAVDFDRRTRAQRRDSHGIDFFLDELETGRLGQWSAASAVDVSPNLSIGGGINYWSGFDEFTSTEREPNESGNVVYEKLLDTGMGGWNFSFGGMYRPGRIARIGVSMQTATSMSLEEDWTTTDTTGWNDYKMSFPAIYRIGASVAPGRWLVAADIEYRDWKSLKYKGDTPLLNPDSSRVTHVVANQLIRDAYESTTRLSLGGEYLFPAYGLRGRAGYSLEPSNFKNAGGDADKGIFTLGMGVLIDRSVMLDATWRTAGYTEEITTGLKEDIRTSQVLMTVSYRM